MEDNIQEKIDKLKKQIDRYNKAYYKLNQPIVSDRVYDRKLKKLEQLLSITKHNLNTVSQVGSDASRGFLKVKHLEPMLSLDNTYDIEDVRRFISRIPNTANYILEDKIDGVALSLIYQKGYLVRALTRGDGKVGDDVTSNAKLIKNIPHTINTGGTIEIRGEVFINTRDFEDINTNNEYANPRNLASGTLKTLSNPELVVERKLNFRAYYLACRDQQKAVFSEQYQLKWLLLNKFQVPSYSMASTLDGIMQIIARYEEARTTKPYPIDGLVIKVNQPDIRAQLGIGTKSPKWAVAYKYNTEKATTRLLDVVYQVGRTGAVTPVAILNPTELCGTVIKRASLHNADYIHELKLHIGDMVEIEKGGEIIPQVLRVTKHLGGEEVSYPKTCPICKSKLIKDGAKRYCPDTVGQCSRFTEQLIHFASRDVLNISGLGEETVRALMEMREITCLSEIYSLQIGDLLGLPGFKEKSAFKLYKGIQDSINQPMELFLYGFGIPGIGKVNAERLCKHYGTWHKLMRAKLAELASIPGFGSTLAHNIFNWLQRPPNRAMVKQFKKIGIPRSYVEDEVSSNDKLQGRKICITGTLGTLERSELQAKIKQLGGTFHSSIKADTDLLIVGESPGKNKISDASKRGIIMMYTREAEELLEI